MSLIYFVTTLWNNPYIPSILSQFTNEIIASPSTNHRDIKILNVLKKRKKKTTCRLFENRRKKTRKILRNETIEEKEWKSWTTNPF